MLKLQNLSKYKENNCLEVKKAEKGLPKSIWETYSSFANTLGGVILLGITECKDGSFKVTGIENTDIVVKEFWDLVNNPQKVSANLLKDTDVTEFENEGKKGIVIHVPRAHRNQKPVYINNNIISGSFRRNGEGDYHCTEAEVKNMIRDQSNLSQDMLVLEDMDLDVLDFESIKRYRNRMAHQRPGHVWEELEDDAFLYRIGGVAKGESEKRLHPTVAGLLMFGYEYEIVKVFPDYFLDYQEKMEPSTRWTDRIVSSSGEWSGNLYDFYFKVYQKITQDIKVPFRIENGTDRIDDTIIHKALREALANALIHACYYERMGLVIKKMPTEIRIENPGALRISKESALLGGNSDPRNATLIKMFNLINVGERAGSGIPNIYRVWKKENLQKPDLLEKFNPDRTILILPTKKETNRNQEQKSGTKIGSKNREQKPGAKIGSKTIKNLQLILEYLAQNKECERSDIEYLLSLKPSRAGELLSILVEEHKIKRIGNARSYKYILPNDSEEND